MVILRRTVKFAINPGASPSDLDANGYGGRPAIDHWGRHFEFSVACAGEPDEATGYLINIKSIDEAVRRSVIPVLREAIECASEPGARLPALLAVARESIPAPVISVALRITPTHSYETEVGMGTRVVLSQKFEFAAAHRLHAPSMTDDENRAFFGKCNNPAGHGHNYVIEPRVEMAVDARGGSLSLSELERVTERVLIEPFDHKHLNLDTREFGDGVGVNPTVENIARVFFGLLAPAIEGLGRDARLREITVWETDRTSATYGEPGAR